jgi:hypothetical protein
VRNISKMLCIRAEAGYAQKRIDREQDALLLDLRPVEEVHGRWTRRVSASSRTHGD